MCSAATAKCLAVDVMRQNAIGQLSLDSAGHSLRLTYVEKMCKLNAPSHCMVGIPCPDDLPFSDALHTKNVFHNEKGEFCNCWMNRKVDNYWLPRLRDALSNIRS